MSEIYERVASLEVRVENIESKQDKILNKLDAIETSLTKYKGFIGGVTFIFSALWAALVFSKEWVINHIK